MGGVVVGDASGFELFEDSIKKGVDYCLFATAEREDRRESVKDILRNVSRQSDCASSLRRVSIWVHEATVVFVCCKFEYIVFRGY